MSAQDGSGRIVVDRLTKRFGSVTAVDDLSFTVEPGSITGFLGPNGAGKSTTMRMILGLATPTGGGSTVDGVPYARLARPLETVGAVLDTTFHPARSARNHLKVYAAAAGLPDERADALLAQVGLTGAAKRRAGEFSLGMRQRLALATALLGDPRVLILDEPANGLDPEGITWLRRFLRHLADQGRAVLVSSHLLAEIQQTVDRVVIIARGHLVRQGTVADLTDSIEQATIVRGRDLDALVTALGPEVAVERLDGGVRVPGVPPERIGELALRTGTVLHELRADKRDLEYLYFQLTQGQREFAGGTGPGTEPAPGPEAAR